MATQSNGPGGTGKATGKKGTKTQGGAAARTASPGGQAGAEEPVGGEQGGAQQRGNTAGKAAEFEDGVQQAGQTAEDAARGLPRAPGAESRDASEIRTQEGRKTGSITGSTGGTKPSDL